MCQALVEQDPTVYVTQDSYKNRTIVLVKVNKEVDKILETLKSSWPSSSVSIFFMDG